MRVYVLGTCDTKGVELAYVRDLILSRGVEAVLVDLSTRGCSTLGDVSPTEVAAWHPDGAQAVLGGADRGAAIAAMGTALARYLSGRDDIAAVLGLGGSGNTALVTQGMRALPIGIPKLMVSTVASGNISEYVGSNDIAMMYSVVDIAGLNHISRQVIGNAANAIAGMAKWRLSPAMSARRALGITMFGVTTPCIDQVRAGLEGEYDCLVFHATGVGGAAMEKLADSGLLHAVLDITTTEVADWLVGGVFACSDDRFGAVARAKTPYVGAPGALDMVNFGSPDTVPSNFAHRLIYAHNPQVTLMRTTPEENRAFGEWIGERLNRCEGNVRFLIPLKGVSALDAPGQPFHDPEADQALFAAIEATLKQTRRRRLLKLPLHINDAAFAAEIIEALRDVAE